MGDWLHDLEQPQRRLLAAIAGLLVVSLLAVGASVVTRDGGERDGLVLDADDSDPSSTSSTTTTTTPTIITALPSTTLTPATVPATPTTRRSTTTTLPAPATTAPPATAPPTTVPGGDRDTAAEDTIASLFTAHRSSRGLAPMTRSASLDDVAARWARVMANTQTLSHDTKGTRRVEIMNACPTPCSGWAENVGYYPTAGEVWNAWLASQGHLTNIEDGHGGYFGVAAYRSGSFVWISHVFGRTG